MERKNFNPADWLKDEKKVCAKQTSQNGKNLDLKPQVENIITTIEDQGLDITSVYTDWRNIGFAFADEFGEAGRALFHRISQFWVDYTAKECDRHFNNFLKSKGTGITIRTFFYLAKQAGVEISLKKSHQLNIPITKRKESLSAAVDHPGIEKGEQEPGNSPVIYFTLDEDSTQPNAANQVEKESRADEILRKSEHKYWLEYEDPIPCIEIVANEQNFNFGTFGNFSLIKGPPKSRKTFFTSMILAAALKNGCIQNKIRCTLPEDKRKIVVFDTEQGESHANKVIRRAFAIANINKEDLINYAEILHVHCLRPYDALERILTIESFIEKTPGVGLVIIDGSRDLIYDTNNIEQSAAAVQYLMKWSHEKNLHIVTVIHINKNDKNATGHLGGELTKKAETVVELVRDKKFRNISIVKPTECRAVEFSDVAFSIDGEGLPEIIERFETDESNSRNRPIFPSDIPFETHIKALKKVFEKEPRITATQFRDAIIAAYDSVGMKFGESKARSFVEHAKFTGLVNVEVKQAGNRTFITLADLSQY